MVSLSACGSFKAELAPGAFVLFDQFVDRTHVAGASFRRRLRGARLDGASGVTAAAAPRKWAPSSSHGRL
jgi:purine nucleoside phosphorylase